MYNLQYILHYISLAQQMPEGPEVYFLGKELQKYIGSTVTINTNIDKYQSLMRFNSSILSNVRVCGKQLILAFETNNVIKEVSFHLGLTGIFSYNSNVSTKVEFIFNGVKGVAYVYLNDIMNIGYIDEPKKCNDILGMDGETFAKLFKEAKEKHKLWTISDFLIDQNYIAGIGNYLRSEILYICDIHPETKLSDIKDIAKLYNCINVILKEVFNAGGSSNYKGLTEGKYKFKVYRRKKTDRGETVKITKIKNRSIYHV